MARMRERIFAGFGAVLFFGSASAVTFFAISQGNGDSTPPQTAQTACAEQQVTADKEASLPDVYKPDGAVADLQSTDLTAGTGPAAAAGDCLQVKYYGTLATDGTVFDEDFDTPDALQFQVGANPAQVIAGWDQGVIGMQAGGTRRLVIPAALAYGDQATGTIPANADLVFVVKLLKIVK
jgi:FKBP-type peptidyl-prolyl cis-trans isomerase